MDTCGVALVLTVDAPFGEVTSVSLFKSQTCGIFLTGGVSGS